MLSVVFVGIVGTLLQLVETDLGKRNYKPRAPRIRINSDIRASEVRVITEEGETIGVLSTAEAVQKAMDLGVDLVEISPNAKPPVAKLIEYGKYQYQEKKKKKETKAKSHSTETKSVQVKINTGDHDLGLKAKKASEWLKEGHRVKVELYLRGRAKYMGKDFHRERIERILKLITEPYKVDEPLKNNPKGVATVISRAASQKVAEN